MSVSITTDNIDIVGIVVGPTSQNSSSYKAYWVTRTDNMSKTWFEFNQSTTRGNASHKGIGFNYFIHGAQEDYLMRMKSISGNNSSQSVSTFGKLVKLFVYAAIGAAIAKIFVL
jgi:hypothetical protein